MKNRLYVQGLWSGVNVGLPFSRRFPRNRDVDIQGIHGSFFALGNFVACVMVAVVGGKLGRKRTIAIGCLVAAVGVITQSACYSLTPLFIGRVLNGFGNVS